ncbi:Hint domain-containing protein [Loktanella sp. DSM 29012]|uniref:Hint domain-containing protein n=1 Tax=Loktanella sp. DSM 29012 TaxID=1881056 RepID=UPI0008C6515A|nr:Hint domain-containing protein [Loktanella sp. DSM 29012]SEP76593.1 Hint domain-containing protein [Loktanella sp. DSM 29012]
MAFISAITYPKTVPMATPAVGQVQITAAPADLARLDALSLAIYRDDGTLAAGLSLSEQDGVIDPDTGWTAWNIAAPLQVPGDAARAVALIDAGNANPVLCFYAPHGPVTAVDGPAAGTDAMVLLPATDEKITFDGYGNRLDVPHDDASAPVSLTSGTMIDTPEGPRLIDDLAVGDLVLTWDGTAQPIRLIQKRRIAGDDLRNRRTFWPVCIQAGALGFGLPHRNLWVSPQHRMLFQNIKVSLMFGEDAVFVRAKSMAATFEQIYVDSGLTEVTYFNLIFDRHEVIFAEGSATESFHPGSESVATLSPDARQELFAVFPELRIGGGNQDADFTTLRSWELMACVA